MARPPISLAVLRKAAAASSLVKVRLARYVIIGAVPGGPGPELPILTETGEDAATISALRRTVAAGRPIGCNTSLQKIKSALGRDQKPLKRAAKPEEQ